ncbi:serine carboxypeptidase 1-like [Salvia splendens]|uniref:serine carboxypeptidase 1-like n=1 Tax=Salvia splendens TaxID=180675 RepID=UPI001C26E617|nr:serine carboxypeptidase 1-like [Salvia splendens]
MKTTMIIFLSSVACLFSSVQSGVVNEASTEYSPVHMAPQDGLKEADKIVGLLGLRQTLVSLPQHSGYVTVDPTAGRALFYWFAEADESSTQPLVLWLSRGPERSSIENGAMSGLEPVTADSKALWYDKKARTTCEAYNGNIANKKANVLFLESPAGNTTSDGDSDTQSVEDSYTFLVKWLERFPEYKSRDFYIAGEGHGIHHVPQLAQLILKNNNMEDAAVINLKGISIANAYIDIPCLMSPTRSSEEGDLCGCLDRQTCSLPSSPFRKWK